MAAPSLSRRNNRVLPPPGKCRSGAAFFDGRFPPVGMEEGWVWEFRRFGVGEGWEIWLRWVVGQVLEGFDERDFNLVSIWGIVGRLCWYVQLKRDLLN